MELQEVIEILDEKATISHIGKMGNETCIDKKVLREAWRYLIYYKYLLENK